MSIELNEVLFNSSQILSGHPRIQIRINATFTFVFLKDFGGAVNTIEKPY